MQTHETIAQMLKNSHALVLPSLHESFGLVLVEAMASGRPVISTRCGGPEFIVNETNGLIVEPGQPLALANAIVDVLTHLHRYDPQAIADAAVNQYSYHAVTDALTRLYAEMLSMAESKHKNGSSRL